MKPFKHWELQTDEHHIAWLGLNRQHTSVNTLNHEVLDELNRALQDIAHMNQIKGLVLYSLKTKGFIAGADVHVFANEHNPADISDFLRKGQAVFARLEAMSIPTVAMIHGFCMGGGLELALACDYRIVSDDDDTRLGLPEVLLGIHPGWGGTVRLPKLTGGFDALSSVMLKGAPLTGKKAKRLGFVDDVVPLRQLKRAAVYFVLKTPPKHSPTWLQAMGNWRWIRQGLCWLLRREVAKKVNPHHYPAPFAMIDLWEKEGDFDERAYLKEAESVEALVFQGETASNLTRLFLLRERIKGFAKDSDFKAQHVHVIGAGVMGGDIAAWCALKGVRVTLQDQSYERIAPAKGRAYTLFCKKLSKPHQVQAAMDRLIPDPLGEGVRCADVIIEAVFESLEVKQTLFKHLEDHAKPTAILATNTSSIPLDEINRVMRVPERLVGVHFFNPVAQMELVEVVHGDVTLQDIVRKSCSFVSQIGKLPLPVRSSPGFLINRVLMPYLMECVQLLEEGYAPEQIDHAALAFGMMMGPVELIDTVGMDVCLAVAENLMEHLGGHVPNTLVEKVKAGQLGKKTGQGFYRYKQGKAIKRKGTWSDHEQEIAHRLILRMVNESAICVREGVVEDADLLDAGMVFATGFAPFRGGPLHYAEHFGQDKLNALFTKLEHQHGDRFKVDRRSSSR